MAAEEAGVEVEVEAVVMTGAEMAVTVCVVLQLESARGPANSRKGRGAGRGREKSSRRGVYAGMMISPPSRTAPTSVGNVVASLRKTRRANVNETLTFL